MAIQTEAKTIEKSEAIRRDEYELLAVAEGFVANLWATIAEEVGLLPSINHDLSASTRAQLGVVASALILDYSD